MIIKSCYIENFGKLNKFNISFNKGINNILKENGFGKTTLASFIRAMFYGVDKKADRDKYSPWQGGKYGGYIVFETNKPYRLERYFGNTKAKDSFKLFDLSINKESKDFSTNIGLELFGIDKEGFENSTFFPQCDLSNSSNDTITARLTNLVDDTEDINSYEKVIKKLSDEAKILKLLRGEGGEIYELQKRIDETKKDIQNAIAAKEIKENKEKEFHQHKEEIKQLEQEIKELNSETIEYEKQKLALDNINTYNSYKEDLNKKEQELDKYEKLLKGNINIDQEITDCKNKNAQLLSKVLKEKNILEIDYTKLENLKKRNLNNEIINNINSKIVVANEILELRPKAELTLSDQQKRVKFDKLKQYFSRETTLEEIDSKLDIYRKTKENANRLVILDQEYNNINSQPKKKIKSYDLIVILIGIISLVFGIIFVLDKTILGISLISFGILSAIIGAVLLILDLTNVKTYNQNNKNKLEEIETVKNQINQNNESVVKDIVCFVSLYADTTPIDLETVIIEIRKNFIEYKQLNTEIAEQDFISKKARQKLEDLEDELKLFVKQFNGYIETLINNNYLEVLYSIRNDYELLMQLNNEKEANDQKLADVQKEIIKLRKEIEEFLKEFYLDVTDYSGLLDELSLALISYRKLIKENNELKDKINEYYNEKKIGELQANYRKIDIENITAQKEEKQREFNVLNRLITTLENEIKNCEEQFENLSEYEILFEQLKATYEKKKKRLFILEKTKEFLESAHTSLSTSYVESINNKLNDYTKVIMSDEDIVYSVDNDLNILSSLNGQTHKIDSFSVGYQDILFFCIRCSIIDEMYKESYPFLILDDPFVNLDKDKLALAKSVVKKLEEKYQIIYLICHESRTIEDTIS